jgi:hypothetical protein
MLFNSKLKSVEEKEIKIKELTEKEFNEINEDISKALNKNKYESKMKIDDDDDENKKDFDKFDIDFFSSNNSSSISNDGTKDNFKKSYIIDKIESSLEDNFKSKNKVVNNKEKYSISKLNNIGNIKYESNESIIFNNNFSYTAKGDSNSSNEKFNFYENIHIINDSFNSNANKGKLNINNQNKSNSINFNFPNNNYSNNYLFMNSNHLSNNINSNQYPNNFSINIIDNNVYNNYHIENIKCLKSLNNLNSFANNSPINNIYYNNHNNDYILNLLNNNKINNMIFQNNLNLNKSQMLKNYNIIKKNINDISPILEMCKNTNDSSKYIIHIENIFKGKDKRTTLIIRNIPNKYTISSLLQDINQYFNHKYNVIYLPLDINNQSNLGYGFIDFIDPMHIPLFYEIFNGKNWLKYNSFKICQLAYSKCQGKDELIKYIHKKLGVFNDSYINDNLKKSFFINSNNKFNKPSLEIPIRFYNCFKSIYPYSLCKYTNNGIFIVEKFYNFQNKFL